MKKTVANLRCKYLTRAKLSSNESVVKKSKVSEDKETHYFEPDSTGYSIWKRKPTKK